MAWLAVVGSVFYYILLPFTVLSRWLLVALAPVFYLGSFILSAMLFPLRLLAKLETLYIYLGVAALIGLVTGSLLHLSSTVLASLFNLTPTLEEKGRSAVSVRRVKEQRKLEEVWQSSSSAGDRARLRSDPSLERKYAEWLEKDVGKRKEDQGLLGQTIIEEDDDSEAGF